MSVNISSRLLATPGVKLTLTADMGQIDKQTRARMVRLLKIGFKEGGKAGGLLRTFYPRTYADLPFEHYYNSVFFSPGDLHAVSDRLQALLVAATVAGHHTEEGYLHHYGNTYHIRCPKTLATRILTMEHDAAWQQRISPVVEAIERGDTVTVEPR